MTNKSIIESNPWEIAETEVESGIYDFVVCRGNIVLPEEVVEMKRERDYLSDQLEQLRKEMYRQASEAQGKIAMLTLELEAAEEDRDEILSEIYEIRQIIPDHAYPNECSSDPDDYLLEVEWLENQIDNILESHKDDGRIASRKPE